MDLLLLLSDTRLAPSVRNRTKSVQCQCTSICAFVCVGGIREISRVCSWFVECTENVRMRGSLLRSFVRSFVRSFAFVRSFVPSFVPSFLRSFVRLLSFVRSFLRSFVPSFVDFPPFVRSFVPSFLRSEAAALQRRRTISTWKLRRVVAVSGRGLAVNSRRWSRGGTDVWFVVVVVLFARWRSQCNGHSKQSTAASFRTYPTTGKCSQQPTSARHRRRAPANLDGWIA